MFYWLIVLAAVTALAATTFTVIAVLWLKKLRETVSVTLTESAGQQIRTAQRLSEALGQMQKQQRTYEQQLQNLAQANMRLRQDLTSVTSRLEHNEREHNVNLADRTLH